MFKAAFKNYFKHIKLVALIMGVIYTTLLIVLGIFSLFFQSALIDGEQSVFGAFVEIVSQVGTGITPVSIFTGDFAGDIARNLQYAFFERFDTTAGTATTAIIIASLLILVSFTVASMLCRMFIKRHIKQDFSKKQMKNVRTGILAMLIKFACSAAFAVLLVWLGIIWTASAALLLVAYVAVKSVANIVEARYIFFSKTPLKELLTARHVALNAATSYVFLGVTTLILLLLAWPFGMFIAVLLGIPLFIYYFETAKFTAVEYFRQQGFGKSDD